MESSVEQIGYVVIERPLMKNRKTVEIIQTLSNPTVKKRFKV